MKLVFGNYDYQLLLKKGMINLVCTQSAVVFSNLVCASTRGFKEECSEPVYLLDGDKTAPSGSLFFIGDICMLDLNDKRIIMRMIKKTEELIIQDEHVKTHLERENAVLQDLLLDVFLQLNGNYTFSTDWDLVKYIKAFGLCIDQSENATLFDKLIAFLNISIDFFPDVILCFVNLKNYLSQQQYFEFYKHVEAGSLYALLYEYGSPDEKVSFENYFFIDQDFIEESNSNA